MCKLRAENYSRKLINKINICLELKRKHCFNELGFFIIRLIKNDIQREIDNQSIFNVKNIMNELKIWNSFPTILHDNFTLSFVVCFLLQNCLIYDVKSQIYIFMTIEIITLLYKSLTSFLIKRHKNWPCLNINNIAHTRELPPPSVPKLSLWICSIYGIFFKFQSIL